MSEENEKSSKRKINWSEIGIFVANTALQGVVFGIAGNFGHRIAQKVGPQQVSSPTNLRAVSRAI